MAQWELLHGELSKDPEEWSRSYYPSGCTADENSLEWDPQQVFDELSKCMICHGEKVLMLPSQKKLTVWRSSKGGEGNKTQRISVDGRVNVRG